MPTAPTIFVSSVLGGLDKVRLNIKDALEAEGYVAWLFEKAKTRTEWAQHSPAQSKKICLDNVDQADLYIGIFHARYGGSAADHNAGIGLTDLEFFEAVRSNKPIFYYVLEPFDPEPELKEFLKLARKVAPHHFTVCSPQNIVDTILFDIDRYFHRYFRWQWWSRVPLRFANYANYLVRSRRYFDEQGGITFSGGRFFPEPGAFDRDRVRENITRAETVPRNEDKLDAIWIVLEELFNVPWKENNGHLDLWDSALGMWDTAASWHSLHGSLLDGKLAADNTLLSIRCLIASNGERAHLDDDILTRRPKTGPVEAWDRVYGLGGAIANEYYSMSKMVWSRALKRFYLEKAASWLDVAERAIPTGRTSGPGPGLLTMRGLVYLQLGRATEALTLLRASLSLREAEHADLGSIAEAKSDIGYALFKARKNANDAERFLRDAVTDLETAKRRGFTIRAKLRLAEYYFKRLNIREGVIQIAQADALCDLQGIRGYQRSHYLMRFLLSPFATSLFNIPKLVAKETNAGYKYEDAP